MADIVVSPTASNSVLVQSSSGSPIGIKGTPVVPLRFPVLKIIGRKLYIVCSKGYLQASDIPYFARYVRSKDRWGSRDENVHRRRTGWIRPKDPAGVNAGEWPKPLHVPMAMVLENNQFSQWSKTGYDHWKLTINGGDDIAEELHTIEEDSVVTSRREGETDTYIARVLNLTGMKLGVCVERGGTMITDYLPFAVQYSEAGKEHQYFLSRWS